MPVFRRPSLQFFLETMMVFNVDRAYRPFSGVKAEAPNQGGAEKAFKAAAEKVASPDPNLVPPPNLSPKEYRAREYPVLSPRDRPKTEAELIQRLRQDVRQPAHYETRPTRGALSLELVKPFLDRLPASERQATVLRLLEAFPSPASSKSPFANPDAGDETDPSARTGWIREGIASAAALSGLATDPAGVATEEFATKLYDRANKLLYRPEESSGDSTEKIAADIRAFLADKTAGSAPEDGKKTQWDLLNRLYDRDWGPDAAPAQAAIEAVAKDFQQDLAPADRRALAHDPDARVPPDSLRPSTHQEPGTNAAVDQVYDLIRKEDASQQGYWSVVGNQQYYDLQIGAAHMSPTAQQKLAEKLAANPGALDGVSRHVLQALGPWEDELNEDRTSLQEKGVLMFARLDYLTAGMEGPLAGVVVKHTLEMMERDGTLKQPVDFKNFKHDNTTYANSDPQVWALVNRLKGTPAGDAAIQLMQKHKVRFPRVEDVSTYVPPPAKA